MEKDLEEDWLKLVDLVKERAALAVEVRQVPKLEAKVDELKPTTEKLSSVHQVDLEGFRSIHEAEVERVRSSHPDEVERLCGLHSMEIEHKYAFCEGEKIRVQSELLTS